MNDNDGSLDVGLHQAFVALSMTIVVDQSQILVLARSIRDLEVRNFGTGHERKSGVDDISSILLGVDESKAGGNGRQSS